MTKNYKLILLIFIQFPVSVFSQGENDNWIFGSGNYISFATGNPIVNPSLNTLYTKEGCASVSDENGNLLFYSDGITVWNSQHQVMMNGNGLLGHPSSTSSCVIVPYPGNKGKYYLFTQEPNVFSHPRLSYNVVDMNLNGGLGMVILKNKILLEPSDEKLAVTRHCNGTDFWIVVHKAQSEMYLSYSLTSQGLSTNPIISVVPKSKTKNIELGYLKFSPDGKWLADARALSVKLLINKFDVKTGIVKQYIVDSAYGNYDHFGQTFYGVAFSASGERLYATYFERGYLFQYDLKEDSAKVLNSKFWVASLKTLGALQLAKDNKIYCTNGYNSYTLNCIEYPEKTYQYCGFVQDKIKLKSMAHLGLPTYVESIEKYFSLGVSGLIKHSRYTLTTKVKGAKYLWSTGDTTEEITVSTSGTYSVKVWSNEMCAILSDEITLEFEKRDFQVLGIDKTKYIFCENGKVNIPSFKSNKDSVVFKWTNSDTSIGLAAKGAGNIPVFKAKLYKYATKATITVIPYRNGVEGNWLSFEIEIRPKGNIISYPSDKMVCSGTEVKFEEVVLSHQYLNYQWIRKSQILNQNDTGYNQLTSYKPQWSNSDYTDVYTIRILDDYCPLTSVSFQLKIVSNYNLKDTQLDFCSGQFHNGFSIDDLFKSKSTYWQLMDKNTFGLMQNGVNLVGGFKIPKLIKSDTISILILTKNKVCKVDSGILKLVGLPYPSLNATFNRVIEVCAGDTLKLNLINFDSSMYQLNWICNNSSIGLSNSGINNIKDYKTNRTSDDQYARILYQISSNKCIGDTGSNYVKIHKRPIAMPMKDIFSCYSDYIAAVDLPDFNTAEKLFCWYDSTQIGSYVDFEDGKILFKNITLIPNKADFKFTYHLINNNCKSEDQSFIYHLVRQPVSNFEYKLNETQQIVELKSNSLFVDKLKWLINGVEFYDSPSIELEFKDEKIYTVSLFVRSDFCVDSTFELIKVPIFVSNHIPNAFSPDRNQRNEVFKVYNVDAESVSFSIFNKWGECVYVTNNNTPWDGTYKGEDCMQDVYVYLVKMEYSNGESKTFKGTVTLLR